MTDCLPFYETAFGQSREGAWRDVLARKTTQAGVSAVSAVSAIAEPQQETENEDTVLIQPFKSARAFAAAEDLVAVNAGGHSQSCSKSSSAGR